MAGIFAKDIGVQRPAFTITVWFPLIALILAGIPAVLGYLAGMEGRGHIVINYYQKQE
jgi:hypothetical protein